jgi:hypothetical protein
MQEAKSRMETVSQIEVNPSSNHTKSTLNLLH